MAITRGTATAAVGAFTTSCTLVINAGVVTNDILVLDAVNRDSTANLTVTDDDSGGNTWTLLTNQAANTNGSGQRWWKRATSGTASKTITVSGATGSVTAVVTPYTGCPTTDTPFGTAVSEANASGNEVQAGITTTRSGSWVLFMVACTSNDTLNPTSYTATDPATLTESGEGTSTGGSDCSVSHASAEKAAIGATGNISWAQTNGTGASIATELLNVASLGDDSDGFTSSVYTPAILASVFAATSAANIQTARAVAITGGDREEIPAGFVQPALDDGYRWTPIIQPDWRATSPIYDEGVWVPEPVAFIPPEDYWIQPIVWPVPPNHPAPPPDQDTWIWAPIPGDDWIPQPRWPNEWVARQAPEQGDERPQPPPALDEGLWIPTPRWPDEHTARQGADLGIEMVPQPPAFLPPEDYWLAPVTNQTPWNFVFYPPDRGELALTEPDIWTPDALPGPSIWTPDAVDSSQDWTPQDS